MRDYDTLSPRVPDGTFSYRKVQPYGPATPITVTVHDGCLFSHVIGEGADAVECPTHRLSEIESAALTDLAWHLRYGLAVQQRESVAA